jgi:peptide/nickel transport system ATP-binding protein
MSALPTPLLVGRGLNLTYGNRVQAVRDLDIDVNVGEIVGLVGESGCGKSSLTKLILRLETVDSGTLDFNGTDLVNVEGGHLRRLRRWLQVVPQDPATSLNPKLTVADSIGFNLRAHRWSRAAREGRVAELLDRVGLSAEYAQRYPHELSGGQLQRVAIARALSTRPDLVICDEPVSALDKSVQAQILNLIAELQRDLQVAFLFVSHDLTVIEHIADRVMVMYLGRIVESGPTADVMNDPRHPYTQALLASIPGRRKGSTRLQGEPPDPADPPSGCPFRTRCPHAVDACARYDHVPAEIATGHIAACLRAGELAPLPA